MTTATPPVRDDRILAYTRGLSLFIAPFLLVAFLILYPFPDQTQRLFAWTIAPTMTPMVLASAYLGGFYFFVQVLRERRWASVKAGFLPVALFAGLLGVATIIHWDRFNHGHVAFWLWLGLYLTAPFLVVGAWLANRRAGAPPTADEAPVGGATRWVIAVVGVAALAQGVVMFIAPILIIPIWPWLLTPLTCRVVGAVFCLGSAGISILVDPRWVTLRLMLLVEMLMLTLMLLAAARARPEFATDRPLTWVMLAGFVAALGGSAFLWVTHEIRPHRTSDTGPAHDRA